MIQLTNDPQNPERILLTATVSLYLDRVLLSSLSAEVDAAIREQAARDLKGSKAVRKAIADRAEKMLLQMLGVAADEAQLASHPTVRQAATPTRNFIIEPEVRDPMPKPDLKLAVGAALKDVDQVLVKMPTTPEEIAAFDRGEPWTPEPSPEFGFKRT
jgi:hypothetical protein